MLHEHDWGLIDNALRQAICDAVSTRTRFIKDRNGKPPTAAAAQGLKWREKNPHKKSAHTEVYLAKRHGPLAQLACQECGEAETEAHHENYNKPLEVTWLCKACHTKLHKAA